jgi:hypothetical protein
MGRVYAEIARESLQKKESVARNYAAAAAQFSGLWVISYREGRLNVEAGAADASRAMLMTSCRKVTLLTAILAFL